MRRFIELYRNYRWVRQGVVPLGFYLATTLVLTYPLVTRLSTHAAGAPYGDAFEAIRLIWWTKEALLQGLHPAYQPLLAYPAGFFSPVQWAAPMAQLAGLPYALLLSPLTAYNLTFIMAFVLTGWAAYLFCRELSGHEGAALLGGLVLMAFPTRLGHATAGHLTLITNYWLLLYAWSLVRLWRGMRLRWAALGGVFFALAAGTYVTNLQYELVPLTAVFGLLMLWRWRTQWRIWLRPALLMFGVAGAGTLLLYLPLLVGFFQNTVRDLEGVGVVQYSADLLAFVTPSPFNPLLSGLGLLPGWSGTVLGTNIVEGPAYLGVLGIGLAVSALGWRRRDAWPWLVVALVGMAFSLGPVLKVGGDVVTLSIEGDQVTNLALPYAFYGAIPGLGMGRTPARLNMVTAVALAALVSYGFAALTGRSARLKRPAWQVGAVVLFAAVVIVEYQLFVPFPTTEAPQPAYFDQLAADAAEGTVRPVLNLPDDNFFVTRWLLYYQTAHHQPVLAGHVVRTTPANPAMLALANAAALPPIDGDMTPAMTLAQQAALLRATGAEVIVVHRAHGSEIIRGPEMAAHLRAVLGEPTYEDESVSIFELPAGPLPQEVLYVPGEGWGDPDASGVRWFDEELHLSYYVPQDVVGTWTFDSESWLLPRTLHFDFDIQGTDTFFLPPGGSSWTSSAYAQPAGFRQSRFWIDRSAPCTVLPGEPACRGVQIGTPRFVIQDDDHALRVNFADKMYLIEAVVGEVDSAAISLETLWQSAGEARDDYTLFVHLIAADAAQPAAQQDALLLLPPEFDSQPTSLWPPDGFVHVPVTLALEGVPPGEYRLVAGLYTYPDIVRLPLVNEAGGDVLPLYTMVIDESGQVTLTALAGQDR